MLETIKADMKVLKMLSVATVFKNGGGLLEPGNLKSNSMYPSMLSGLVDENVTVKLSSNNSSRHCKGIVEQRFKCHFSDMQINNRSTVQKCFTFGSHLNAFFLIV